MRRLRPGPHQCWPLRQQRLVCGQSGSSRGPFPYGPYAFLGYSCGSNLGDTSVDTLADQEGLAGVLCQAGAGEEGKAEKSDRKEVRIIKDRPGEWWPLSTLMALSPGEGRPWETRVDSKKRLCYSRRNLPHNLYSNQTISDAPCEFCSAIFVE